VDLVIIKLMLATRLYCICSGLTLGVIDSGGESVHRRFYNCLTQAFEQTCYLTHPSILMVKNGIFAVY